MGMPNTKIAFRGKEIQAKGEQPKKVTAQNEAQTDNGKKTKKTNSTEV